MGIPSRSSVFRVTSRLGGIVTAAGDEDNIALNVRGKGTGPLVLGSTGSAMTLNSTTTQIGSASTTAFSMFQRYRVDFTVPALTSNAAAGSYAESSLTVAGLTIPGVRVFKKPSGAARGS